MKITERVRALREKSGQSRTKFAEETGVSAKTLQGIEGENKTPGGEILEKIANRFPQYAAWLVGAERAANTLQEVPGTPNSATIELDDVIDPRFAETTIYNLSALSRIVFYFPVDSEKAAWHENAFAVAEFDEKMTGRRIKKFVAFTELNFESNHGGGYRTLKQFRSLLRAKNSDLLAYAECKIIGKGYYELSDDRRFLKFHEIPEKGAGPLWDAWERWRLGADEEDWY